MPLPYHRKRLGSFNTTMIYILFATFKLIERDE
jgi:hypothetical protein